MTSDNSADAPVRSTYRERVLPGFGVWAALALISVMAVVAGSPVGAQVGLTAGLGVFAAGAAWGVAASLRVEVTQAELRVGRATLPRQTITAVSAQDAAATRRVLGPDADARAYLAIRGWVKTSVRIDIDAAGDPTPYWVVSTRHPDRLAAALGVATATEHEPETPEPSSAPQPRPGQ